MESGLSMSSRAEITTRFARAYVKAGKADKGRILDRVVEVTGWSRDNARRQLTAASKRQPGQGRQVATVARTPRARKYSYDALKGGCPEFRGASLFVKRHLPLLSKMLVRCAFRRRA